MELAPYVVARTQVSPGDLSFNGDNIICQVNQSTCIWFDYKVIGEVNSGVDVVDGEMVDIFFKCAARDKCNYPFCGSACPGNDGFYIPGREERGY